MRPRFAILLVAAVWLAHAQWSTSHEPTAEARPRPPPTTTRPAATNPAATGYVPAARPALHLPVEPPRFVEPSEPLPEAWAQTIHGTLHELEGEPMIGATVVATSPALQGEQVVITDENGYYRLVALPPGTYTLTVYYNNNTYSEPDLVVGTRHATVAELALDVSPSPPPTGEVIAIAGTTTQGITIDRNYIESVPTGRTFSAVLGVTTGTQGDWTGVAIDDTYTKNIPTGRTFGEVLGASAGSQVDSYGTTNDDGRFVFETIASTDGSQNEPPDEFIEEIEIITGGTSASVGPATVVRTTDFRR